MMAYAAGRRASCILWAALLLVASSNLVVNPDEWQTVILEAAARELGATCLDGTASAYYFRPAAGSNQWIVHLEGGGWCATVDECYWMSTGVTGSNRTFLADKAQHLETFQGGAHGFLSSDPEVNPYFHNFNKIIVRSCDGSSWSSDVEAPQVAGNGIPVFFRGFRILKATIDNVLLQMGSEGSELVISGCSSGGHAVWMHLDHIRSWVPPRIRVVGIPASGIFLNMPVYNKTHESPHEAVKRFQDCFTIMGMASTLNKDCLNNFQEPDEKWKCYMAEYQIPYIKTPYFAVNSMFDKWNMQQILAVQVPCIWGLDMGRYLTMCKPQEIAAINKLRRGMVAALKQQPASASASYFAYNCAEHCGQLQHDHQWSRIRIDGMSLRSALANWYFNGTAAGLVGTFAPNVNIQCRLGPHDSVFAKQVEYTMNLLVPRDSNFKQRLLLL